MIGTWIDYSAGPVSGATMAAHGITGSLRYVGIGTGPKRLTVAERDDQHAHGRIVLGVLESTANRANAGYSGGVADGQAGVADPAAAGLPYIIGTNDQPTFTQTDVDYIRGLHSVMGPRTGAYGFADFLKAVRAHVPGVALWWQAGEPPNLTGTQSFVHFWQRQGTSGNGTDGPAMPVNITLDGVSCDLDNQLLEVPVTGPGLTADQNAQLETACRILQSIYFYGSKALPADLTKVPDWRGGGDLGWFQQQMTTANAPILAQLSTLSGALSADEAAILSAVQGADSDTKAGIAQLLAVLAAPGKAIDVAALASDIAADLPPQATPAQIFTALASQLTK